MPSDRPPVREPSARGALACGMLAALLLGQPAPALAWEYVYTPVNPSFGGSPLNGGYLLGRAQAQDRYKDPTTASSGFSSYFDRSQLDQFNDTLQRVILSRVASAVSSQVVGNDGRLAPGTVETTDFTITIADLGGGRLRVSTTDKLSGQTTTFDIGQ
jgi:curli production assembly/transport component CsgF